MGHPCGICSAETTDTNCVLCCKCNIWFHADCENISKTVFSMLSKNKSLEYKCVNCVENPADNSDDAFKNEMRAQFANLRASINSLASDMSVVRQDQSEIKSKFESLATEIRSDLTNGLEEMRGEVQKCKDLVDSHDAVYKNKFMELELQNHCLQHRLNRADIIVSGLPGDLEKLNDVAVNICSLLKVDIAPNLIDSALYIRKRRSILVKFKNIVQRDEVMRVYYKSKSIKVSDVIGGSDGSRVYLNDNYSTLANKIWKICIKLKRENKITGFSLINREILTVKFIMPNNVSKILNFRECVEFFKSNQCNL